MIMKDKMALAFNFCFMGSDLHFLFIFYKWSFASFGKPYCFNIFILDRSEASTQREIILTIPQAIAIAIACCFFMGFSFLLGK